MKSIKVTTEIIESLNPCKSRFDNFKEKYPDYSGTILDFLSLKKITPQDKLWVAVRLLPRHTVEVLAIDCAFSADASASAAYTAANAADYATAASNAAYHAAAAAADYAADYAAAAYTAADAAAYYAANAAADAAAYASMDATAYASADAAERKNQIEVLKYLINEGE